MSIEKLGSVAANFLDAIDFSNILKRCFEEGKRPCELEQSGELVPGDHLFTTYGILTHHGLYSGDGMVIHYKKGRSKGIIEVPLHEFAKDVISAGFLSKKIYIKKHNTRIYSNDESISRARSRIGEAGWNLLNNNCEHFVEWCINGKFSPDEDTRHTVNDKKPVQQSVTSKAGPSEKFACIIDNPELLDLFLKNSPCFNINFITLGGKQKWNDICIHSGWRLQQNKLTSHMRVLDPGNIRRAWGPESKIISLINEINEKFINRL